MEGRDYSSVGGGLPKCTTACDGSSRLPTRHSVTYHSETDQKPKVAEQWWCTPLIPALERQISEYKASLVCRVSSRTPRLYKKNLVLKK